MNHLLCFPAINDAQQLPALSWTYTCLLSMVELSSVGTQRFTLPLKRSVFQKLPNAR